MDYLHLLEDWKVRYAPKTPEDCLLYTSPVVVNVLGRFVVFQHGEHGFDFPLQGPNHKGLCDVAVSYTHLDVYKRQHLSYP